MSLLLVIFNCFANREMCNSQIFTSMFISDQFLPVMFNSRRNRFVRRCALAPSSSVALYDRYASIIATMLSNNGIPSKLEMIVKIPVMTTATVLNKPARNRDVGATVMTAKGIHIGAKVAAMIIRNILISWFICFPVVVRRISLKKGELVQFN